MSHDNLLCALFGRRQPTITPTTTATLSDQDDHQQQPEELTIRRSRNSRTISRRRAATMNNNNNSSTNNSNKAACIRQPQQQPTSRKLAQTRPSCASSPTILCLAAAALILAITFVGADYAAQQPQQQQQQSTDTFSNGGYDNQQQQQAAPKAKKIQIVYIKVPLAKLKPSLAGGDYAGSASNADNSTYAAGGQHDSTDTKPRLQGSQSVVDQQQQQQQQYDQQQQQLSRHPHQSSFLIPMAVVSNSEQHEQQSASNSPLPAPPLGQEFPVQHSAGGFLPFDGPVQVMHDERMQPALGPMHFGPLVQHQDRRRPGWPRQSPMQLYHQLMAASASSAVPVNSVSHGINHGFMSSFLMGEKEKMTAAAMRVHQQHQQLSGPQRLPQRLQSAMNPPASGLDAIASSSSNASYVSTSSSSSSSSSSMSSSPAPLSTSNHQQQPQPQTLNQSTQPTTPTSTSTLNTRPQKQSPGGLMPVMMMPFSHMPDSMIGQAYNAAVGQALPIESGSPANLLGSPSSQLDHTSKRGNNYANGGNTGTNGDSGSSLGTTSSGSYGANGQSQLDNNSAGSAYQQSGSGSANYGPSSGSGSGTNIYGASGAFSDFPATQSIGSGPNHHQQQAYGPQQQPLSSNNNPHHIQSPMELSANGQGPDSYGMAGGSRLRQAKKTIIPIVVQVEHAILENNQHQQAASQLYQQGATKGGFGGANKYQAGRGYRQLGGKRGGRKSNEYRNQQQQVPYGAASNESPLDFGGPRGQYIDAANAQDINKITAAINAENAASAAAALAQADMAFGNGAPAYMAQPNQRPSHHQGQHHHHQGGRPGSQYASGLQSAASALLANTHPVIQAAASGGLASVTKLGAKLGEMIALPSMSVPGSISAIGSSLPSALSSITNQMGVQLNQAVQQVAKEHPTAHAFARQVAQHAGLNLPNFNGANLGPSSNNNNNNQYNQQNLANGNSNNNNQLQMAASSSNQQQTLSPQAQLQNLKLSIGQNLQTAAAQLMGVSQKANAQSAATLLANPLAALYPQSMNAALKQLSSQMAAIANQQQPQSSVQPQQALGQQQAAGFASPNAAIDSHHAQSSSLVPVQQAFSATGNQQQGQISQLHQQQVAPSSDSHSSTSAQSALVGEQATSSAKPGKASLKSKFLSFFQPPKFISNLLSWNDRADDRNDQGSMVEAHSENVANLEAMADEGAAAGKSASETNVDKKEEDKSASVAPGKQSSELSSVVSNGTSEAQSVASDKAAPVALDTSNLASASASSAPASPNSTASVDETKSVKSELEASSS